DDVDPLVRVVEELSHGDGRRRLRPELLEVADVLGREGVLEEEQLERLDVLGEADRVDRRQPFMDIVEQLDLVAEVLAEVLEELRDAPAIRRRLASVRRAE